MKEVLRLKRVHLALLVVKYSIFLEETGKASRLSLFFRAWGLVAYPTQETMVSGRKSTTQ